MKTFSLALISLVAVLLFHCSPPSTDPNAILQRLLDAKIAGRDFVKQPSGKDTLTYYGPDEVGALVGTSRIVSDHLVITVYTEEGEMDHWYDLAVYAHDKANKWKPVFAEEVVRGRLDTIIDLDGDLRPEFIVDEYNGNSAGFNSVQALYARLADETTYNRIDTLSHRYFGGAAYNVRTAKYSYVQGDNSTMIAVSTEQIDMEKVTKSVYLLYWQPPNLMREGEDPPPEQAMQDIDLVEAQSILDELDKPERKNQLLAIKYTQGDEGKTEHDELYFAGSLSDVKFRDYQSSDEGGGFSTVHLEFENNSVVRAIKRIGGMEETTAILFYLKGGQEQVVSLSVHPSARDSWGRPKEIPTNIIPGDEPAVASVNYEFDPDNDKYIAFIREHAADFTPGKKYVFEAMGDMGGTRYEVDSLLWVKEFAK